MGAMWALCPTLARDACHPAWTRTWHARLRARRRGMIFGVGHGDRRLWCGTEPSKLPIVRSHRLNGGCESAVCPIHMASTRRLAMDDAGHVRSTGGRTGGRGDGRCRAHLAAKTRDDP